MGFIIVCVCVRVHACMCVHVIRCLIQNARSFSSVSRGVPCPSGVCGENHKHAVNLVITSLWGRSGPPKVLVSTEPGPTQGGTHLMP